MKILYFKEIESTNIVAKSLIKKGVDPFTVIVAESQIGGYGKDRKAGSWFSPKGGLYFTIVLPKINISHIEVPVIILGWSIAKTLKDMFPIEPMLKLPNDIYIQNKKVGGVLIENIILEKELKYSLAGVGLNTNIEKKSFPKDLKGKITSLKVEIGDKVDNKKILKNILKNLKKSICLYEI